MNWDFWIAWFSIVTGPLVLLIAVCVAVCQDRQRPDVAEGIAAASNAIRAGLKPSPPGMTWVGSRPLPGIPCNHIMAFDRLVCVRCGMSASSIVHGNQAPPTPPIPLPKELMADLESDPGRARSQLHSILENAPSPDSGGTSMSDSNFELRAMAGTFSSIMIRDNTMSSFRGGWT